MGLNKKHVLFIVENLPVPFDTRVWQEANALKEADANVSIICPAMKGFIKRYECLNGIDIYRHPLPFEAKNAAGFIIEYICALFWQFFFSWKIFIKKRFHVLHGCNPPDLVFIIASAFKLFGVKYVFDHHDLSPELYFAKFGKKGIAYNLTRYLERLNFKTANYTIATNDSYKEIAIERGRMKPDKVHVVRSGPNLERVKIKPVNQEYKKSRKYLVSYVGVIGKQDGLHLLLQSIRYIINKRSDVQFAIVGDGTELETIKKECRELQLQDYMDFYGRVPDDQVMDILSSADLCVNPDEPTELNQLSTMNKIMEYMALKKPIVQFDLKEGRVSAQDASLYARNYDTADFGEKIIWLLNNEQRRIEMGDCGYSRIINKLSWDHERNKLIVLYEQIFGK